MSVGALLEAKTVHPGRSARNHLLFLAQTQALPARRVDEVLALVGLQDVADKRSGGFSLGRVRGVRAGERGGSLAVGAPVVGGPGGRH